LFILAFSVSVQAAQKTIGVIMTGDIPYYNEIHTAFADTLTAQGFGVDKVRVSVQKPSPGYIAWANAARRFAVLDVDVIVSYGAPSTLTLMKETSGIPIVFAAVPDPAAVGISGKNITGVSSKLPVSALIKYFRTISHFSTLGVIYSSIEKDTVEQTKVVKQLGRTIGFKAVKYDVRETCGKIELPSIDALFVTTSSVATMCVDKIIQEAREAKLASAALLSGGEEKGIILTVYADPDAQGQEVAKIVVEMLKGRKPSSVPVQELAKTEMIINVGEAKRLGLNIPLELLTSATRIIR
jgi:putative ABC transport system substrate-binding protein